LTEQRLSGEDGANAGAVVAPGNDVAAEMDLQAEVDGFIESGQPEAL
jgi:hypothetical protein